MRILIFIYLVMGTSLLTAQDAVVNALNAEVNVSNQEVISNNEDTNEESFEGVDLDAIDQYDTEYLESEAVSDIPDEYFLEDYSTDSLEQQPAVVQNNASSL